MKYSIGEKIITCRLDPVFLSWIGPRYREKQDRSSQPCNNELLLLLPQNYLSIIARKVTMTCEGFKS